MKKTLRNLLLAGVATLSLNSGFFCEDKSHDLKPTSTSSSTSTPTSTSTSMRINRPPTIDPIPDQYVWEGGSKNLYLREYINDDNDYAGSLDLEQISGPGNFDGTFWYNYEDCEKDLDSIDDVYIIEFNLTDRDGASSYGSFRVIQKDTYSRISMTEFDKRKKWICYSPTNFDPNTGTYPDETSIKADLQTLKDANYKGIVTYSSNGTLALIPELAREEGFENVIAGVWDIESTTEFDNAVASSPYVDGYCLGNEGLLRGEYNSSELDKKMEELRRATRKPVTTSEPPSSYNNLELYAIGDWVFPNIHPYWANIKDPELAASWTYNQFDWMRQVADLAGHEDLPLVIKEEGLPTSGEPDLSEENQKTYYRKLAVLSLNYLKTTFVYFEAFDQPWKNNSQKPVEPYWGLFHTDRSPKSVSEKDFRITYISPYGTGNIYWKDIGLAGVADNYNADNYKISAHIYVEGNWWLKPYANSPLTTISEEDRWGVDITTGGVDPFATKVSAALVTPDYIPSNSLPDPADPRVIESVTATRN